MQERRESGQFVVGFDMGIRARRDDDVERTMPHRLIGDIDVAAVRVARLGHTQIGHGSPNLRPY